MTGRVVLDAATLDGIANVPAFDTFTVAGQVVLRVAISPGERDALVAAARENAALREALEALLAVWLRVSPEHVGAGKGGAWCNACMKPWPCPAKRARLLLAGDQ